MDKLDKKETMKKYRLKADTIGYIKGTIIEHKGGDLYEIQGANITIRDIEKNYLWELIPDFEETTERYTQEDYKTVEHIDVKFGVIGGGESPVESIIVKAAIRTRTDFLFRELSYSKLCEIVEQHFLNNL